MKVGDTQRGSRIAWVMIVVVMVACAWLPMLDAAATRQVDAGLKRALLSFASARALNAVISVAQGTELAVEPAGVGLAFTIGEVLDPVNDLVEQLSSLMLAASIAFGIQKVLITIGAHWPVPLLLTMVALAWAWFRLRGQSSPAWLTRVLVVLLMTRFAVPVVTIGTDLVFQQFLATDYGSSQQVIETTSNRLGKLSAAESAAPQNNGAFDQFTNWWSQNGDARSRFERLKQTAEQTIDHIIGLMVIFVLQTLIIPLLLLWILFGVIRRMFESPAGTH